MPPCQSLSSFGTTRGAGGGYPGHAQCKVMYDQAFIAARGYTDAQAAKQLYWDCLKAR